MRLLLREAGIFAGLFILLSLIVHFKAWIDHPIHHLTALPQSPLGPWHPLFLTALVYLVTLLLRVGFRLVAKLFRT